MEEITQFFTLQLPKFLNQQKLILLCLWDEIQRWYMVENEHLDQMLHLFKSIVITSADPQRVTQQFFVCTGSSMVAAWHNFLKTPTNGHSLETEIYDVSIVCAPTNLP